MKKTENPYIGLGGSHIDWNEGYTACLADVVRELRERAEASRMAGDIAAATNHHAPDWAIARELNSLADELEES